MESAVYLGVDIGKSSHYALAIDSTGKAIYQTGVPNDEAALSKLVDWARNARPPWWSISRVERRRCC